MLRPIPLLAPVITAVLRADINIMSISISLNIYLNYLNIYYLYIVITGWRSG